MIVCISKCVPPHWRIPIFWALQFLLVHSTPIPKRSCTCLETPFCPFIVELISTSWVLLCFGVNGRLQRSFAFREYLDLELFAFPYVIYKKN